MSKRTPLEMMSIRRTLGETEDVIRRCLLTNNIPMIWGESGVGKTEMIEKLIASIPGCMQITLSLGSRDPLDFTGIPSLAKGRTINNDPILIPLEKDSLGTDPEGNEVTCVVVYVDELPEGDVPTLKAIYRLLNERMVNNSRVHPAVRFVASGNPPSAGALTEKLIPTVANRMMHIEIKRCHKEWIRWATNKGISPVQRAFIAMHPNMLSNYSEKSENDAFATPRTHARLHSYMNGDLFTDKTLIAQGAPVQFLGEEAGVALLTFAAATDLPNMDKLIGDPDSFNIKSLDAGTMFLLGQSLITLADEHNIESILKIINAMPDNHKAINFMAFKGIPRERLAGLMQNPVFIEFVSANANLLDIIREVK